MVGETKKKKWDDSARRGGRNVQYQYGPDPEDYKSLFKGDDAFLFPRRNIIEGNIGLERIRRSSLTDPLQVSHIQLTKRGVVGTRHMRPTFAKVEPRELREQLKFEFEKWAMDAAIGDEGTLWEIQMKAIEALVVDGEHYIIIQTDDDYSHGFACLNLQKEMLANYYVDDDKRIYNGVEYDDKMKVVAYHFRPFSDMKYLRATHSGEIILGVMGAFSSPAVNGDKTTRIPAEQVICLKVPSEISRSYNNPSLCASFADGLRRLRVLDDMWIRAYIDCAVRGGIVETDKEAPMDDIVPEGWNEPTMENVPEQLEPGHKIKFLARGQKFVKYEMGHPGAPHEGRRELIRTMTAPTPGGYTDTNSDYKGASFSSVRHAYNHAKDAYRYFQKLWAVRAGTKIVRHFLTSGIIGKLGIPMTDMQIDQALMSEHDFRTYPFVDPQKEAAALEKQGAMGLRSVTQLASEQGNDADEVMNDDLARAAKLGIPGTPYEKLSALHVLYYGGAMKPSAMGGDPPQQADNSSQSGDDDD